MTHPVMLRAGVLFDTLEERWESFATQRRIASGLVVVFRYFGFAVATVMIRLALTAPRVIDAALEVAATLFAIALTWVYNRAEYSERLPAGERWHALILREPRPFRTAKGPLE